MGEVLSCKVLECIERDACNTGVAFYSHASPFYQAYRGQCLCYSGSFVCSKPPKGTFIFIYGIKQHRSSTELSRQQSIDFLIKLDFLTTFPNPTIAIQLDTISGPPSLFIALQKNVWFLSTVSKQKIGSNPIIVVLSLRLWLRPLRLLRSL